MPLISMIGLLLSPGTSLNVASMVRLITGVQSFNGMISDSLQQQVKVAVRFQLLLANTHGLQTGPINIFYIIIIRDVPIRIHTVWGFDVCKTDFVSL